MQQNGDSIVIRVSVGIIMCLGRIPLLGACPFLTNLIFLKLVI